MTNQQHFDAMKNFGGARTLDTICEIADWLGFEVQWQGGMRVFTFIRFDVVTQSETRHVVEGQWEALKWLQGQA